MGSQRITRSATAFPAQTQHTLGHLNCGACECARLALISGRLDSDLFFPEAAERWLAMRTFNGSVRHRFIKPNTIKSYRNYIRTLNRFFCKLTLREIHLGHMSEYQHQRSEKAGPNKINQELGLLVQIKKRSGTWTLEMADCYQPFQAEESDIPQALSPDAQDHFLRVLASRKEYEVVYWYTLVSLRTTMGTNEMRGIQLGHINLFSAVISVPNASAKNKYRLRTIPLTEDAAWAIQRLIERAQRLGASQPQHYLFPFRICKNHWDAARSMSEWGLRKPWEAACAEAGIKLRLYDLRHTAATRYAEAGTPIAVIMSYMGHVSRKMFEHYCRISEQSQRLWQARTVQTAHFPVQGHVKKKATSASR